MPFRLSFILVFLCSIQAISQSNANKRLVLKDVKKEKTFEFTEGNKVRVWKNDGQLYKGDLKILNDSLIQVNGTDILLSEITHFKASTSQRKVIGGVIFALPFVTGAASAIIATVTDDIGFFYITAGSIFSTPILLPAGAWIGLSNKKSIASDRYLLYITN